VQLGDPPPGGDGAALLADLAAYTRRYVVVSRSQAIVGAAFVVHTHAFEAADATAYIAVGSPEPSSGKTRLLEAWQLVVRNPWLTGSVTGPTLARGIAERTLLLDESDAAFSGDRDYAEALRAVLNTGYRRGGIYSRTVPPKYEVRDFSTFSPKVIAGLTGRLPDTVSQRSCPFDLQRKKRSEHVERFRERDARALAEPLRDRTAAWAAEHLDALRDARPEIPDALSDRAADCVEPLLAIADAAGGDWPRDLRHALLELYGARQEDDDTIGVRLLSEIRTVFGDRDRLTTTDLLTGLHAMDEAPWGDWYGKPLAARGLANLLKRFQIRSRSIWLEDGSTPKGFHRDQFTDLWERYLSPSPSGNPPGRQEAHSEAENDASESARRVFSWRNENGRNPASEAGPGDLADATPP
jgi:Protein of unknown function (DUF3631)